LSEVQDQVVSIDAVDEANSSTFSYGYNASQDVTNAMADIPGWLPIIVVVVIGALLIGLVSFLKKTGKLKAKLRQTNYFFFLIWSACQAKSNNDLKVWAIPLSFIKIEESLLPKVEILILSP